MGGTGRIYQRGEIYFVAYSIGGREFRESTRSRNVEDAHQLLEHRLPEREAADRQTLGAPRVTFDELAEAYLDEYRIRELRTLTTARLRIAHLRTMFVGMQAAAITATLIRRYQAMRREQRAAAATVNRETAALHRLLRLGARTGRLPRVPIFPERLRENPPRQGFFEYQEYLAVRAHLPAPFQDVLDFAYYSGWRKREITELTWDEIDFEGGLIRLHPGRCRTGTGRLLPLSEPLQVVLARRVARRKSEDTRVFLRDGVPIREWRTCLRRACVSAGVPARLLHDCRRTAARNFIRAGVPERVAMALLGHKTRCMFDRYNIVSERDLLTATTRLTEYLQQAKRHRRPLGAVDPSNSRPGPSSSPDAQPLPL